MATPTDIVNQALDAIGWSRWIGDIEEGTREAQVSLRAYSQCLRQLLRAANWNFARQQTPLVLLADASGQTADVGSLVITPWQYEYAYPENCMKARFIPYSWPGGVNRTPTGNYAPANSAAPVVAGLGQPPGSLVRLRPARFLEAMDPNYPVAAGANYASVQGMSPQGRTVLLTNVKDATLVFTALMSYPSNWDSLFRAAFVAYLASEIALPVWTDKDRKFGIAVRGQQMQIAAEKIRQARATDGNEGYFSSDIQTDWMQFRRAGGVGFGRNGGFEGGAGIYFGGCDDCCGVGGTSAY